MLVRLVLGLVKGLAVSALAALLLTRGLGVLAWGSAFAYVAAAASGVLVGLVAGKPIWAEGAKIEAGLKAFFGALLGAGAMLAVRRWIVTPIDLGPLSAGVAPLGEIPAASLGMVTTALALFYEIDNTGSEAKAGGAGSPRSSAKPVRVAAEENDEASELEEDDAPAPPPRPKARR
jgi:hypothetical protein